MKDDVSGRYSTAAGVRLASWLALGAAVVAPLTWLRNPGGFIVDDSYFYLVVARRLVLEGRQTFSGPFLTNGVHPLWFYLLALWDKALAAFDPAWLWSPRSQVLLSAALLVAGTGLLLKACRRAGWHPGAAAVPIAVYLGSFGVLYSEAHALFLASALLLWCLTEASPFATLRRAVAVGACCAAVFLARLDAVFWCGAVFAIAWARFVPDRRRIVGATLIFTALVAPYLLSNLMIFGGLAPVSGWMKSSFPIPHPAGLERGPGLSWMISNYNIFFGWAPVLFAALSFGLRPALRRSFPFQTLLAGCLLHLTYTTLFAASSFWYWYYVLDVLAGGIALTAWLPALPRWLAPALAVAICAGGAAFQLRGTRAHLFDPQRVDAIRYLEAAGMDRATVLVSESPGTIAYYTHANVVANDFLTADRHTYARVAASPNALSELFRITREAGDPIQAVLLLGDGLFKPSADGHELVWLDPKNGHHLRPFGSMTLPPLSEDEPGLKVWRLP